MSVSILISLLSCPLMEIFPNKLGNTEALLIFPVLALHLSTSNFFMLGVDCRLRWVFVDLFL